MINYDAIVIGAGPAGLIAAISINSPVVLVLEKMAKPGIKLLLSGSTQCNITHDGAPDDFLRHYGHADNFVKYMLRKFSNRDLISFFEQRHIRFTVTDHGKIFPQSLKAKDILDALLAECRNRNIAIATGQPVQAVEPLPSGGFHCVTACGRYRCTYLVIAAGGRTYPATGSSGDGYVLARSLGHSIAEPRPALAPVIVDNYAFAGLAGISLKNAPAAIWRANKKLISSTGDILFTHEGLSGPGILNISRYVQPGDTIRIDLTGGVCPTPAHFRDILQQSPNLQISTVLRHMNIPRQLAYVVLACAGAGPSDMVHSLRKETRAGIYESIAGLPFAVRSTGGFDAAMVTAGGVNRAEISTRTMQSKLNAHLFFAGEVIDVDGDEGGYNLQFAFSSGMLAGTSISNLLSRGNSATPNSRR